MSKKRTRSQKQNTHYNFSLSWSPQARVNRQINIGSKAKNTASKDINNADITVKEPSGTNLKKDIIKSLITVSFILSLELVIYLAWNAIR